MSVENGLTCFQQEVWEAQRQIFEAAKQAGVEMTEEVAFSEQMERLLDADVVLVAYPVLSQEASTRSTCSACMQCCFIFLPSFSLFLILILIPLPSCYIAHPSINSITCLQFL